MLNTTVHENENSPSCKAQKVESFANAIMPGTSYVLQHLQIRGSKWGVIITLLHKMTSSYVLSRQDQYTPN